jgi:hypothetical protein
MTNLQDRIDNADELIEAGEKESRRKRREATKYGGMLEDREDEE